MEMRVGLPDLGSMRLTVRDVDRGLLLDKAALGILGRRLGSLGDDVHALDDGALLRGVDLEDAAGRSAVFAAENVHHVSFLYM